MRAAELLKVWEQAAEQLWHILPKGVVRRIGDTHAGRVVNV